MLPANYLDDLFQDFAPGQKVLAEVRNFYGPSLRLIRHDEDDGVSHFSIDHGGASKQFREARIDLNTKTDRALAAAFHELLHLRLPLQSFPIVNRLEPSIALPLDHLQRIENMLKSAVNVAQHDIFVTDFLSAGLPIESFLVSRADNPEYGKLARQLQGQRLDPKVNWDVWAFWCFEYFNNRIGINHGDLRGEKLATSASKWGARSLPDFKRHATSIETWLASGQHLKAKSYPSSIRVLADIFHLPVKIGFCELQKAGNGPPSVLELQ